METSNFQYVFVFIVGIILSPLVQIIKTKFLKKGENINYDPDQVKLISIFLAIAISFVINLIGKYSLSPIEVILHAFTVSGTAELTYISSNYYNKVVTKKPD